VADDHEIGRFLTRRLCKRWRLQVVEACDGRETRDLAPVKRSPLRALLVEDNLINQKLAASLLGKAGCRVDVATDGREAVRMASQFPYDVIFMDCQMPEMDGYEATAVIRDMGNRVPIVAMTASAMPEDRRRCLQCGMDEYRSKPIVRADLERLLSILRDRIPDGG
jgi:two-component system sensor histidine kinase/response regulator